MKPTRANFKIWAAWGVVLGVLTTGSRLAPWVGDNIRLNLIELFAQGIAFALFGVICAAIWNWAGRLKR